MQAKVFLPSGFKTQALYKTNLYPKKTQLVIFKGWLIKNMNNNWKARQNSIVILTFSTDFMLHVWFLDFSIYMSTK